MDLNSVRVARDWAMRFAADLHLHSRYSSAVSPAMTVENIARWALRKGLDLLGTGDCLQPQWLAEIEAHTVEAEPGLRMLKPETGKLVQAGLPAALHRPLRFVLSTEVNCVPPGTGEMEGLHQLLYFPSLAVARDFAARIARHGDLQEGRPTLGISAQTLLRGIRNFDRVHLVPAHVMNPWFSVFGVIGGETNLEKIYGDELPQLLAVETGLTSNPVMCRRLPGLDRFALFSSSDAHSLDNLGRECTLFDIEPSYDTLMAALRAGTRDHVCGTLKFPLGLTRHYLNWCSQCQESCEGKICPRCGRSLTMGSRDRLPLLDQVRPEPVFPDLAPPFETLMPLAQVIATVKQRKSVGAGVLRAVDEMVGQLGQHERGILTETTAEDLMRVTTPEIAQAILAQRTGAISRRSEPGSGRLGQGAFEF